MTEQNQAAVSKSCLGGITVFKSIIKLLQRCRQHSVKRSSVLGYS